MVAVAMSDCFRTFQGDFEFPAVGNKTIPSFKYKEKHKKEIDWPPRRKMNKYMKIRIPRNNYFYVILPFLKKRPP